MLAARLDWSNLPPWDLDIADLSVKGPEYERLCQFYVELKSIHGVGPAVATKLMYLKWPYCTVITDRVVRDHYAELAEHITSLLRTSPGLNEAAKAQKWTRLFTFAVQHDVQANRASGSYDLLRATLASSEKVSEITVVSDCRLHDMLIWAYGKAAQA